MTAITVIKLGGSLTYSTLLTDCLDRLDRDYQNTDVVVVPGGGAFADQVRLAQQHWCFDDRTAHCMALLAMQQMAWLIVGLKPAWLMAGSVTAVQVLLGQGKPVVWSPDVQELDQAGIAATWDITSDSLAAWLAGELAAQELLLIKAAKLDPSLSVAEWAAQGLLDDAFCRFVKQANYRVRVVSGMDGWFGMPR